MRRLPAVCGVPQALAGHRQFRRHPPDTASSEDIRRFQLHLARSEVSISNRNRTMTGLRFLFRVTPPECQRRRDRALAALARA